MTAPSMVELLSSLEADGLIVRYRHPAGGRSRQAQLTSKGFEVMQNARTRLRGVEERLLVGLTAAERDMLADLLERCLTSLEAASSS
jgi:DNA-binding MarR family transcriptional regulator